MAAVLFQTDDAIDLVRGEQVAVLPVAETTFRTLELPEGLADHAVGTLDIEPRTLGSGPESLMDAPAVGWFGRQRIEGKCRRISTAAKSGAITSTHAAQ